MSNIYIQLKDKATIPEQASSIKVRDIADITANDPCIAGEINVYTLTDSNWNTIILSANDVIRQIHKRYPNNGIHLLGVVENVIVQKQTKQAKTSLILVVIAWVILFLGAGLTIVNFHEDVSMKEVHQNLHYYFTGEQSEHPYWLQIPYSIGIGLGMTVFFNHLFRKKINNEPSPLEVEMFLYQDNVDKYTAKNTKQNQDEGSS